MDNTASLYNYTGLSTLQDITDPARRIPHMVLKSLWVSRRACQGTDGRVETSTDATGPTREGS